MGCEMHEFPNAVFCLHFCFLMEKIVRGMKSSLSLLKYIYGSTNVLGQHWKCSQKRLIILMYFTSMYIERSGSTLKKKCCLRINHNYSLEWSAVRKVCSHKKKNVLECMQIFQGGGGGGTRRKYSDFLGRSVQCDPRTLSFYHSFYYPS